MPRRDLNSIALGTIGPRILQFDLVPFGLPINRQESYSRDGLTANNRWGKNGSN